MTKEQLLEHAKPILFNTDMVQAILDNRKSCTRRIVKGYIPKDAVFGYTLFTPDGCISCRGTFEDGYGEKPFWQSYHRGDILYVRETYCPNYFEEETQYGNRHGYKADYEQAIKSTDLPKLKWVPSIHMPKAAARIFLKVTDVRVERLQDITDTGAEKEGAQPQNPFDYAVDKWPNLERFKEIWNSTIKKADLDRYGWEANPWVWVIEFERVIPE